VITGSTLYDLAGAFVWAFWLASGLWVLCAICAGAIARARHTSVVAALLLGIILGPAGVMVVASERKLRPVVWGAPPVLSGPWGPRCRAVSPNGVQ
jgi:hypothetical protein